MNKNIPWNRKYRPATLDDLVVTPDTKAWVESIISTKMIPNITLYSSQHGVGKTTIAKLIANSCCGDDEILFINGSLDRGIDVIRNEMTDFITCATFQNGHKCIIIDEADSMSVLTLAAMRAFMEEWDKEVSFILTCNDLSKFSDVKTEPILSRCPVRDLSINKTRDKLGTAMLNRLTHILRMEGVEYEIDDVKKLILAYYPDIRIMINHAQSGSLTGTFKYDLIKTDSVSDINVPQLTRYLKAKDYLEIRTWAKQYYNAPSIYDILYSNFVEILPETKFEELIMLLGKYSFESGTSASKEITFTACLLELGKLL